VICNHCKGDFDVSKFYRKSPRCKACDHEYRAAARKKMSKVRRIYWSGRGDANKNPGKPELQFEFASWRDIVADIGEPFDGALLGRIDLKLPFRAGNVAWKTFSEVMYSRSNSVLTSKDADLIRRLKSLGARTGDIALRFDVDKRLVVYHAKAVRLRP
jgi:hypothetical protein